MKTLTVAYALCFLSLASAAPEEATRLSYEVMAKSVLKEDSTITFPEEIQKLEGKRVKVSGFVVPYDDPERLSKFLMMKTSVGCYFCNPPAENEVLFIRLSASESPIRMSGGMVAVEGTLHLKRADSKDDEANQFAFTLDEAKQVPPGP